MGRKTIEQICSEKGLSIEEALGSRNKRVVIIPAERHVLVLDDRLGVHRRVRNFIVGLADGTIGSG